jgi:hypothetical protein
MLRALCLVGLLGLACCASAPEEATGGSSDAVTTGGAWRSPINEGYYDDGTSSLFVSSSFTKQKIVLHTHANGHALYCHAPLDIPLMGGSAEMTANDDEDGCALTITASENGGVNVKGTIDYQTTKANVALTLVPRKDNAFVGTFSEVLTKSTMTITATSNMEISLSVVTDGSEIVPSQTAKREDHYDWFNINVGADCPMTLSFWYDSDGKRSYMLDDGIGAKKAKCPVNLPLLFSE